MFRSNKFLGLKFFFSTPVAAGTVSKTVNTLKLWSSLNEDWSNSLNSSHFITFPGGGLMGGCGK